MIEELLDRSGRHAPLLEQVEDHAWVERATAGPHRQTVERSEAHGRIDA